MNCFCFFCFLLKFSLFTWRKARAENKRKQDKVEEKISFFLGTHSSRLYDNFCYLTVKMYYGHFKGKMWRRKGEGWNLKGDDFQFHIYLLCVFHSHELSQWIFCICISYAWRSSSWIASLHLVSQNSRIPMEWRNKNNYTSDAMMSELAIKTHPASFLRLILSRQRIL